MRGGDERSGSLFSYVDLEARVGKDHPLRTIRGVVRRPPSLFSCRILRSLRQAHPTIAAHPRRHSRFRDRCRVSSGTHSWQSCHW
jgi:hypothetical protein